jgi:predicted NUDIX family NTP pyrophosphohydrolase
MTVTSAGLLLYRRGAQGIEVLLGHMGGPLWARKDTHGWSIPKGLYVSDGAPGSPAEDPLTAAEREFAEELGHPAPSGATLELGTVRGSGKLITVFAREGDFDADTAVSNTFAMQWPPRSGRIQEFPEIDRAAWFELATAAQKLVAAQRPFLDRLATRLG